MSPWAITRAGAIGIKDDHEMAGIGRPAVVLPVANPQVARIVGVNSQPVDLRLPGGDTLISVSRLVIKLVVEVAPRLDHFRAWRIANRGFGDADLHQLGQVSVISYMDTRPLNQQRRPAANSTACYRSIGELEEIRRVRPIENAIAGHLERPQVC